MKVREKYDFFPSEEFKEHLDKLKEMEEEYARKIMKAIDKMPKEFQQIAFQKARTVTILGTVALRMLFEERSKS